MTPNTYHLFRRLTNTDDPELLYPAALAAIWEALKRIEKLIIDAQREDEQSGY